MLLSATMRADAHGRLPARQEEPLEVRLLGSLEVAEGGLPVAFGGTRQRAVLALLVLHANEVVPAERLLVELWGEDVPPTAANALQAAVSRVRRALPQGRIVTRTLGYLFRADPDEIDVARFERLLAEGREALARGAAAQAAGTLRRALSLWRGPALADFRFDPFAQTEIARLEELRLICTEERIEADLALGAAGELVGELQRLVAEHPLRERLRGQLMLALYRADRQADALAVYRELRELFAEELGLEPAPALRELETAILRQDPSLGAPQAPPHAGPPAPARKQVTVLCAELRAEAAAAAELDAEALDAVLGHALGILGPTLERHGGRLSAVAGERILGVFGVPTLHEDDALRAAHAALAGQAALDAAAAELEWERGLRLAMRCGLATGEALVGGPDPPGFTGDAIRRAVDLAGLAAAGEILVSEETRQLAAGALTVERAGPGRLRLLAAQVGARPLAVRLDAPMVGRETERRRLVEAFAAALRERAPVLATVRSEAGVGKTRLARELAAHVAADATVLTASCLPYGEGITFWPLRELVRQAGAAGGTRDELEALLPGEADAGRVAELLAAAIGPSGQDGQGASSAVEIFWATRRLLETLARRRPLLVVLEDLHWAEPTFLDLVEALAAQAEDAPMLLLCLARPELADQRPGWPAGARLALSIELEPLGDADAVALLDALTAAPRPAWERGRLLEAAAGNPLFLEQLVASLGERPLDGGAPRLPPTIQALLAARLERLGPGERAALERAAVLGVEFSLPAIAELLPEQARPPLGRHLRALVAKGLVQPRRAGAEAGEDFRFRHILVQQAAYRAVPKSLRADLHERFSHWLERAPGQRAPDLDELLGYHLEQAYRYRLELGRAGPAERALAARAARLLATAARGALTRGDLPAGAGLLERAVSLLPPDDPARSDLLPTLGAALLESGRLEAADRVLQEATDRAAAGGDQRLEARARVERQFVRLQAEPSGGLAEARRVADSALGVLEERGDDLGLCRAWCLRAWIGWTEGLIADADEAWRRAAEHARRAGDERELFEILGWRASAAVFGPLPVTDAIRRCGRIREQVSASPVAVAVTLHPLGLLHAMDGDFDQARRLIRQGNEILDELGRLHSAVSHHEALVEMLAGQPAAAEERLRLGYERLQRMGERALLATTAAMLAQALHAQGRDREAGSFCLVSERTAAVEDLPTQVKWRGVRAMILGREGLADQAEALAREAVRLAEPTDMLTMRADALLDLAGILGLRGLPGEAEQAARDALALFERKEDRVSAARARLQLTALAPVTGRLPINGGA
jgi:DNA-binding SARP family transcriptional activator/tetratricopeptide (TPR) repeat protein